MSPEVIAAAVRLADTLAHENRALTAMDLARAASLLDEKTRAMDAFLAAQALARATTSALGSAGEDTEAEQLAGRLRELARENRHLLEHAIAVQGRVIGMVARALPRDTAGRGSGRYGAKGAVEPVPRLPIALSSQV